MTDWWSIKEYPYEVWHPESENGTQKFRTWNEALSSQKEWNKDCPGHVARKRKIELIADVSFEASDVQAERKPDEQSS